MNLGKIARFSEEIRPQTARYAMKREVAAVQPVFPLSMSDFKPGDKEYCDGWRRRCRTLLRPVDKSCAARLSMQDAERSPDAW